MKQYFQLQYTMTNRKLKDAGANLVLAYGVLIVGFIGLSILLFQRATFAPYIYILIAASLIMPLSEKRRTEFLQICFGDTKVKKIRITENLICILPFFIFLIVNSQFLQAALLLVFAAALAIANFNTAVNYTILTPFSKQPFEFSTGFRNTFLAIIAAYILAAIGITVANFNLGVFGMLLVFVITLTYYANPEDEYYVWSYNISPNAFLFKKLKIGLLFASLLALPVSIALSIFFTQNIGILTLFFLAGIAFLACLILAKYSAYPNQISVPQGLLLAASVWFPPLFIVLIPYFFKKSQTQLNALLK